MTRATIYLAAALSTSAVVYGDTLIIADDYNAVNSGTGFALGSGVNSEINPPTSTRLTGTAADNLYYYTTASRSAGLYRITSNKAQIGAGAATGRFVLTANGTSAFDFGSALGSSLATASSPITYDITISMANRMSDAQRFSFGVATTDSNVDVWDFGLQLYRANASDTFNTVQKRIDTASAGVADLNSVIATTGSGTVSNQFNFLMRVTDAGAESSTYNSRVQVSMDGGNTFIYDTDTDAALPNGWRLDGTSRYFIWDMAGGGSGNVTYDNFSVTVIPEPSTIALAGISAVAMILVHQRRKNAGSRQT